jgi:hypothetical protein
MIVTINKQMKCEIYRNLAETCRNIPQFNYDYLRIKKLNPTPTYYKEFLLYKVAFSAKSAYTRKRIYKTK